MSNTLNEVNEKQEHQALYRKYRPSQFDGLIGQNHIKTTIINSLANATISHAYLFTGPRGTGKTTTAKLFAKALNCENPDGINPCGHCDSCKNAMHDIIELDAASNNKVEDIRELCENVNLSPMYGKYKIYILDEVHMLTTSAFNAFLKTLEEPPRHVIFILATTEVHKLPATILSRCQRFDFRRINQVDIVSRLKYVLEQEGRKAEEDALYLIAQVSAGGLRDALSLLDQALSSKTSADEVVKLDDVLALTGAVDVRIIGKLISLISQNKTEEALEYFNKAFEAGKDPKFFIEEMLLYLRDILVFKKLGSKATLKKANTDKDFEVVANLVDSNRIYFYLDELQETLNKSKFHHDLQLLTEMMIIRMSQSEKSSLQQQIDELRKMMLNGLPQQSNDLELPQHTSTNELAISDVQLPNFNETLEGKNSDDSSNMLNGLPQQSNDLESPQHTSTNESAISDVQLPNFNELLEGKNSDDSSNMLNGLPQQSNNLESPQHTSTNESDNSEVQLPSFNETLENSDELPLFNETLSNVNEESIPENENRQENMEHDEVEINDPIGFINAAQKASKNGTDWATQIPSEVGESSEPSIEKTIENNSVQEIPNFNQSVPEHEQNLVVSTPPTVNQSESPELQNNSTVVRETTSNQPIVPTNIILSEKEKVIYDILITANKQHKADFNKNYETILNALGEENISSKSIFRDFAVAAVNENTVILVHQDKIRVQLIEKTIHRKNIKETFENVYKPLDYIAVTEKEWITVSSLFKK